MYEDILNRFIKSATASNKKLDKQHAEVQRLYNKVVGSVESRDQTDVLKEVGDKCHAMAQVLVFFVEGLESNTSIYRQVDALFTKNGADLASIKRWSNNFIQYWE